ncbi:hypothetical protein BKA61DRAFT_282467 [Leptodontidium sp. MPI-SDFR-AT-0119]|nr:hypothetical protein BKA61DRAFT_282467 [Leptodontidium sp. MPI-SDFR-AT-0119]
MFRWYQDAARCYVYLSDVSVRSRDGTFLHLRWESTFRNSQWFMREWTLQELLAPKVVHFYSRDESRLGDKQSLGQQIVGITGIPMEALLGQPLSRFTVENRFSWAQNRQTTMEEDKAYSHLGIFGVFLPLIYGEGQPNALRRLRKEVRESIDVILEPTIDLPAPGTAIEEVFVGVMGPIGSGKRSLIELIVGPQDDLLDPVTRSSTENIASRSFLYAGRSRVNLVEFPGFVDRAKSDAEILSDVASWLAVAYRSNIQLCGIIYLHRNTDLRMGGTGRKNL